MKLIRILMVAGLAVTGSALQPAFAQTSDLQVVHGINGLDVGAISADYQVDIAIDGSCEVSNAVFEDVTFTAAKVAGIHDIEVFVDDTNGCTGALLFEGEINLTAGGSSVAILHLDETGTQTISQANFPQDFEAGKVRIAGFHGAWASRFNLSAIFVKNTKRKLVYKNLANGEMSYPGKAKVGTRGNPASGKWKVKATQSGESIATTVTLVENTAYLFILVGDPDNGTVDVIVASEPPIL